MAKYETMSIPVDAEGSLTEEEFQKQAEAYHADYDEGKGELVMPDYIETNGRGDGELTEEQEAQIHALLNQKIGKSVLEAAVGR